MVNRWFILLAIISLQRLGSAKPISKSSDDEEDQPWETRNTNDNFYLNVFFGMSVEKPEGWHALSTEELYSLLNKVSTPISTLNDLAENLSDRLIPLFSFNAFPLGEQTGSINPNILALAENVTGKDSVSDDCDIIRAAEQLKIPNMKPIYRTECRTDEINGVKYAVQDSTWNMLDTIFIKQIQFLRNTGDGYVLTFTLTYSNENDMNTLVKTMKTIHFSK